MAPGGGSSHHRALFLAKFAQFKAARTRARLRELRGLGGGVRSGRVEASGLAVASKIILDATALTSFVAAQETRSGTGPQL